jgi:ABC-type sugar transport system permease subunit
MEQPVSRTRAQRAASEIVGWRRLLRSASPYLYLAPALIFIGIFVYYPFLKTIQISFYEWNLVRPNQEFIGFENYTDLLTDDWLYRVLGQSVLMLLLAVLGSVVIPILLAFLTLRLSERELDFYQSALFLPTVVAANVAVLIWVWFYLPTNSGFFNSLLRPFGVGTINWLNDSVITLPAVSLVANWKVMGFHFLIAIAGLKAIPRDYIEAAYVDGAAGWSLIRYIILPLFAPTGLFLLIIALLQGMEHLFVPIEVMTNGGPAGATNNIMYAIYQEGFKYFRAGIAAALSVILIALFGGLVYWQYRLFDRRITYER